MTLKRLPLKRYFLNQLWDENQVLVVILGICSVLGITTNMHTAITMGAAVIFVTGFSSLFISIIRKITPESVRMITQLAVISTFVIIVDQFLKAYHYEVWKQITTFIALIITNCIVMGRAESMAKNVPPLPAFLDGVGAGLGYAWVLLVVGFFREILGLGQFFGYQIIPPVWYASTKHPDAYQDIGLMITPPGAFFVIAGMIWLMNFLNEKRKNG